MTRKKLAHDPRSDEQFLHEEAMSDVAAVLTNLQGAIDRARKSVKTLGDSPSEINAKLALTDSIESITAIRKRLERDTIYADPNALRLM